MKLPNLSKSCKAASFLHQNCPTGPASRSYSTWPARCRSGPGQRRSRRRHSTHPLPFAPHPVPPFLEAGISLTSWLFTSFQVLPSKFHGKKVIESNRIKEQMFDSQQSLGTLMARSVACKVWSPLWEYCLDGGRRAWSNYSGCLHWIGLWRLPFLKYLQTYWCTLDGNDGLVWRKICSSPKRKRKTHKSCDFWTTVNQLQGFTFHLVESCHWYGLTEL